MTSDTPLLTLLSAVPRFAVLMRSQYWSADRLAAYQRVRLMRTFRAAMRIPFYAARFGDLPLTSDLTRLPILRRAEITELSRSVRTLYPPSHRFILARSSGTTGLTIEALFDRMHQSGRNAARARYLFENGWRPIHRTAWAIGLVTDPPSPDSILSRSRFIGRSEFFSHTEDFIKQIAWMRRLNPHFIYTLPSNLEALLWTIGVNDPGLPALRKVFTGGEVLDDSLRERTRRILGVEIADNYGSTELFPAWQCPAGSYHLNAEHVMVELLDDGSHPVKPGELGRVVVTTLENYLQPLIRYDSGDYALAIEGQCECGRSLPRIGKVVGRSINLFRLRSGELYLPWRFYDHLGPLDKVQQLQLVQRAIDYFVVRYVRAEPVESEVQESIEKSIAASLGNGVTVRLERVDQIARTPRGKFMAALCEIAPAETSR